MLDYTYYKDQFHGKLIPKDSFDAVMRQACVQVIRYTRGRAEQPLPEDLQWRVNDACCAAAEIFYQEEQSPEVVSESIGKWTRTYTNSGKTVKQRVREAIRSYLDGTGLLYCGVNA